jgi:hypothetical protein
MSDPSETPGEQRPRHPDDYEDRRFHDDDEVVPVDDVQPRSPRPGGPRKPARRPPPRRRYPDDD